MRSLWIATVLVALSLPAIANAGHHQWTISELFSNHDGTVQFVELLGNSDNEQGIGPFNVDTSPIGTTGSVMTTVNLAPNLPTNLTNGRYLLIGTAGYMTLAAQQGAPAPDRIMPDNFLELDVDTVRYAGIGPTDLSYTAGGLPTDGIDSLDTENPGGSVNTPQNFDLTGSGPIDASVASVPALPYTAVFLAGALFIVATGVLLRRRAMQRGG